MLSNAHPAISASQAVIRRGDRLILDHVDLAVGKGEIVTIIGPNGAGKSTLIRTLIGLERLTTGAIYRAPRLSVAYLPQNYRVDPALPYTVRRLLTLTKSHKLERIEAVLSELGIASLLDAQTIRLSGGELQRVMLARVLLCEPDLLVLDEPTQNIDLPGALEIYQVIARLRARTGCAVLLVSHDLNLVMSATDRVYCVNGHICCSGRPIEVSRDPAFVSLFGEATAKVLAPYAHHHDHTHPVSAAT